MAKRRRTNNDLQNITQKTKDQANTNPTTNESYKLHMQVLLECCYIQMENTFVPECQRIK
jgi:hypothetical protein